MNDPGLGIHKLDIHISAAGRNLATQKAPPVCVWQGKLIRMLSECPWSFLHHTVVLQSQGCCPGNSSYQV